MKQYEVTARLGQFFADERTTREKMIGTIPRPQLGLARPAIRDADSEVQDANFRHDYDDLALVRAENGFEEVALTSNNPQEERLLKVAA